MNNVNILLNSFNYIVLSPDIDGLLSYILYKKFINKNAETIGIYNCKTLNIKEGKFEKEKILFLDHDVNYFASFGHHFLIKHLIDDSFFYNPNLIYNTEDFKDKCPFSTVMLLLSQNSEIKKYFFDSPMSIKALFLYADSFFILWKKYYRWNCENWLKKVGLQDVLDFIENNQDKIEEKILKLQNILINDYHCSSSKKYYAQSCLEMNRQKLFDFLCNIFKIETENILFEKEVVLKRMNDLVVKKEEMKFYSNNNKVFSHARTYAESFNLTVLKEEGGKFENAFESFVI